MSHERLQQIADAVRKFDEASADYLLNEAPKLMSFGCYDHSTIASLFLWDDAPQGWRHWGAVDIHLHNSGFYES